MGPDDFAAAVRGEDPQHLVIGWPRGPETLQLDQLPAAAQRTRGERAVLSLPTPGDPLGLAGPSDFNAAAVDQGEAVIIVGPEPIGLIPGVDARTVLWHGRSAATPLTLDPSEEGRLLRQALLTATAELVRLDVASWQPDIPDLLLNLHQRPELPLPPGTPARTVETIERADLCLEIIDLARLDDGGAITSYEASARIRSLGELDAAARRALVAACSASLVPS